MRQSLFQNKERTIETTDNIQLAISRPNGRDFSSGDLATGRYDKIEERWIFNCSEPETLRWLEASFAQPVNVIGGCLPIHSMDFVTYMRDVIAHRKGLVINIQEIQEEE